MFALVLTFLACVEQGLTASCVVDSFTVKEDFEPARYVGKWYALQKKDPEGLFLQDNIQAEYTVGDDGAMVASSRGRVTLFGFWVVFADMAAQYSVPDPTEPGKMFMNYQGLASYLSSGEGCCAALLCASLVVLPRMKTSPITDAHRRVIGHTMLKFAIYCCPNVKKTETSGECDSKPHPHQL